RRVLKRYGYARYFTHSTGHGLGREVHELPRIARGQTFALPEGAVITVEPGVYLPGFGGVRIEDVVVVRKGRGEVLTRTSKELTEL
ncbi:MAG TPA: M24 family metallopeptidase, partial [Terriglobia bacterium]